MNASRFLVRVAEFFGCFLWVYRCVITMLAAWPKRDGVARGRVSEDGCRNLMAARGQKLDRRMIRTKLRETREEINSEQNIITGVRRRLDNHCRKWEDFTVFGGGIIDTNKLAEGGFG